MNHLRDEKSPYLLQHANNPVDWYPWCEKAFEKAQEEDKPVFLSIGYSTCHWCHVMAHESFEDEEVADVLNKDFISIKVDREERPDIDGVYMEACQAFTGSGGWPLTVVLTPEKKPFFAGTYYPKNGIGGHLGLMELLTRLSKLWKERREAVLDTGSQIAALLTQREEARHQGIDDRRTNTVDRYNTARQHALLEKAARQMKQSFDNRYGGFSAAPKFPIPHQICFLLEQGARKEDKEILQMAEKTLDAMACGGIFDHIGGGFSRYSTDEKWLVPHFEKMLYDNALFAYVYVRAFQIMDKALYKEVAELTCRYILRELQGEEGGFYCGQDADSEGIEGKYYVFTPKEIEDVLGKQDGACFCERYHITREGNFEGKSIPNQIGNPNPTWEDTKLQRQKLYDYRLKRTTLHRDDKVLLSWNGWAILALTEASETLAIPEFLETAKQAQKFIRTHMEKDDHRLVRRYRDGQAAFEAQLEDYAVYGLALLKLYEVTMEPEYFGEAILRAEQMIQLFWDEKKGGFFVSPKDGEMLIFRQKETYDGAIPSGNSVAALLLCRLVLYTAQDIWKDYAQKQLHFLCDGMGEMPVNHSFGLLALLADTSEKDGKMQCEGGRCVPRW